MHTTHARFTRASGRPDHGAAMAVGSRWTRWRLRLAEHDAPAYVPAWRLPRP